MIQCPYCGHSNSDTATDCRKCKASLPVRTSTTAVHKPLWFGPEKARALRTKALAVFILGMMIKVYWGGQGPWPVVDNPTVAGLRAWLEPLLLYGGIGLYLVGMVLRWI